MTDNALINYDKRSAEAHVLISGRNINDLGYDRIVRNVIIDQSINKADLVKVTLNNISSSLCNDDMLREGRGMHVSLGYATYGLIPLAQVILRRPEYNFISPQTIVLSGFSEDIELMRIRSTYIYKGMTYSEIAQDIASQFGLGCVYDDTEVVHPTVSQINETPYEFLRRIGLRCGRDILVRNKTLFFIAPFDVNISEPIDATDPETKWIRVAIEGEGKAHIALGVSTDPLTGSVNIAGSEFMEDGVEIVSVNDIFRNVGDVAAIRTTIIDGLGSIMNQIELGKLVDGIANRSASVIRASAKCVGKPWLTVGKTVIMSNIGRFTGPFKIVKATHVLNGSEYTTEIVGERAWTYETSGNVDMGEGFGQPEGEDRLMDVSGKSTKAGELEE